MRLLFEGLSKDDEYLELIKNPIENYNVLREMVKQEAEHKGYTVRVIHGTQKFGFTVIDTHNSDDNISFFTTNDEDTAQTYSAVRGVRPISSDDIDYDSIEDIEIELYNASKNNIIDLVNAVNRWSGYYNSVDITYITNVFEKNITTDMAESSEFIFDEIFEIISNLYEDDEIDFEEWMETAESEKLFTTVNTAIESFLNYKFFEKNYELFGNYEFYANIHDFLEIDCEGKHWNKLDMVSLPDLTLDKFKKYNYRYSNGFWTTRSFSQYAFDRDYDGVIYRNIIDDGGKSAKRLNKPSDVYVFFKPQQQLKSADIITYIDGEVVPLSQRFNTNSDDIRETLEEDITKINNTDEIQTEVTSSHDNQLDAYMVYIRNGQVLGGLTYYEYEEEPYIGMIEVEKEYRNQGIGTALMKHLQSLYPNTPIHTGYRTADGTEFFKKILIKQYNSEYANLKKELELCTTRLKEIDDEFEMFAKKDSYSPAEFSHMEKLDEEQFELLHRQQELIDKLDEMSEYDEFVKMENLKEEFTKIDTNVVDGLNFRDKSGKLLDKVFSGEKEFETRDYTASSTHGALPNSYLNRKIGVIQTANGKAKLVGYWELGDGEYKDYDWLDNHRKEIGNDDTEFDIVMGDKKWVYPIKWAKQLKTPIEINSKGIRSRKINYENTI